jgi:hypothetical protein
MEDDVRNLGDVAAVRALSEVAQRWFEARGLQANVVMRQTEQYAHNNGLTIAVWAIEPQAPSPEAGAASRRALAALLIDDDLEIRSWAKDAVAAAKQTQIQVLDPLTLAVGGFVLAGLILAARIKKVGPDGAEFYEGIPKELANVLKAGANFFSQFGK